MHYLKHLLVVCFVGIHMTVVFGQCVVDALDLGIPDDSSATVFLEVSGLVNDDLSSIGQGICQVEVSFIHEYLGDLTIQLVSPFGQMVTLVGPQTSAINPTNLSNWNISFLPCGFPVAPDAGFTNTWNNDQSWQILTNYSGSYYPNLGCLEDFDIGSANGIWSLVVTDGDPLQLGTIASFSISFCDGAGLECNPCEPNSGRFDQDELDICQGDNIETIDYLHMYDEGDEPNPEIYRYLFVLAAADSIFTANTDIQTDNLAIGDYTICGLSYLVSDSMDLSTIADTASFTEFLSAVNSGIFCSAVTDTCIELHINAAPTATMLNRNICPGDTVFVGDRNFSTTGTFNVNIPLISGCDSLVILELNVSNLHADIATPDLINCDSADVFLDGRGSVGPSNINFRWFSDEGAFLTNTNLDTVRVSRRARYFLIVSDGICSDTTFVDISGDDSHPSVFVEDAILNCFDPTTELSAQAFPFDVVYDWILPGGGMILDTNAIGISVVGSYIVRATNPLGCSSVDTAYVIGDFEPLAVELIVLRKECNEGQTIFRANPTGPVDSYSWTGPNDYASAGRNANVSDIGFYVLTLTGSNGCVTVDSIFNDGDFSVPDIDIFALDSIRCGLTGTQLNSSSSAGNLIYNWSGPEGYTSSQSDPFVTQAGQYVLTIESENACTNTDTLFVFQSDQIFDYQIISDTITCKVDTVTIGINAAEVDIFDWQHLPGTENDSFIQVSEPLVYTVIMTDTISGCTQQANISVGTNFETAIFRILGDTITCGEPIANITFEYLRGSPLDSFYWTGPGSVVLTDSIIQTNETGRYNLFTIGETGCIRAAGFNLITDTLSPRLFIETEILGCVDSTQLISFSPDSVAAWQWQGPEAFMSDQPNPYISTPGLFQLTATGLNGCVSMIETIVEEDVTSPNLLLLSDSLTCLDTIAELSAQTNTIIDSYVWLFQGDTVSLDSTAMVSLPGQYIHVVTGQNMCRSVDTVFLYPPQFPIASIELDTLTCSQMSVDIVASSDIPMSDFIWSDDEGMVLSNLDLVNTTISDTLFLSITATNGCVAVTFVVPPIDTLTPSAQITQSGAVKCANTTVLLDATSSSGTDLIYSWQASPGIILSGSNTDSTIIDNEGTYILILQNGANGCTDADTINIIAVPDSLDVFAIHAIPPLCFEDANGMILLDSIIGGVGSVTTFLDGEEQVGMPITGLMAGTYELTIQDTLGCFLDTFVIILEPIDIMVDLGPDREVFLGDTVHLNAGINFDSSSISSIGWNPNFVADTNSTQLLHYIISPLETVIFDIEIINEFGCVTTDQIAIFVSEKGRTFVPNVFSPNGDGSNDELRLFAAPGVEVVDEFSIYDRWGNLVFGARNFDPIDQSIFWDGQLENDQMMPAVFTYILTYRLINGKSEIKTGDILLIR